MKRNLVLIAAFFFLSLGCSSLEKTSAVYLEALEGARSEKASQVRSQKVIEAFERACGLGNQAACLQVDPNREGIRLSRIPILQTATGPTSTQVTVLTEVKARPMFLLWNEKTGQLLDPVANEVANREYSPFEIANLRFENLEPGALYRLEGFCSTTDI